MNGPYKPLLMRPEPSRIAQSSPIPGVHTVDAQSKVERWMKEKKLGVTAAARKFGVPQPSLSQFLSRERNNLTADHYRQVAEAMGTTIDALLDPRQGWPLPARDEKVAPISSAERELLAIARQVSQYDEEPALLATAKRRLLGLPIGVLRPAENGE